MAAHLTGDAGGPPPPGRSEVLLREAVDRLRRELDAARESERRANNLYALSRTELRAARQVVAEVREHLANDQIPCGVCVDRVGAYDKAMRGK